MKTIKGTFLILLLALALATPATSLAQRQRGRRSPDQRPGGGGAAARNFEALAPGIGEQMPDALVYDDEGTSHRLPDVLRGHYSVLILGCLT